MHLCLGGRQGLLGTDSYRVSHHRLTNGQDHCSAPQGNLCPTCQFHSWIAKIEPRDESHLIYGFTRSFNYLNGRSLLSRRSNLSIMSHFFQSLSSRGREGLWALALLWAF